MRVSRYDSHRKALVLNCVVSTFVFALPSHQDREGPQGHVRKGVRHLPQGFEGAVWRSTVVLQRGLPALWLFVYMFLSLFKDRSAPQPRSNYLQPNSDAPT